MSREREPPTTLPAGDFEPLRPPEPVPAPPLPEEPGGDNDGGDNDGGDNDGGDNDGECWPPQRTSGGDTDQLSWPDQDRYGPDSEFAAAAGRIADDGRPGPARPGWGKHAQWADSLPVGKPEQSCEAAQARLEQEWSAVATSGSSGTDTSAVSPLRSPIVRPSAVDTNAAGTNGAGTNGCVQAVAPDVEERAGPGTDEYRHDDEPGEHGPSGRRGDEPDAQRAGGDVGRHVRRPTEPAPSVPPTPSRLGYIPRHAMDASGEFDDVSATDVTEILARVREDPTEAPRQDRPEPERRFDQPPPAPVVAEPEPAPLQPGKRVKVVLSQRKGQARSVRIVVDVQELTQVGEVLSSSLIRSQLGLSLRIAAIALLGLGSLPAMFSYVPRLAALQLFGVRLPWLLLGAAVYPALVFLGWFYSHCAENLEKIFSDDVQS